MNRVNKELIDARSRDIKGNIDEIRKLTSLNKDAFFEDARNIRALKNLLLESIEAMAVICNHLVAKFGNRPSYSYAECFESLEELSILSNNTKRAVGQIAKFRNLLVHGYWKTDNNLIYEYGKNNLSDFEDY